MFKFLSYNLIEHIVFNPNVERVFIRNEDVNVAVWLLGINVRTFCFDVAFCDYYGNIACHVDWNTFEKNSTEWYPEEHHVDHKCKTWPTPQIRRAGPDVGWCHSN